MALKFVIDKLDEVDPVMRSESRVLGDDDHAFEQRRPLLAVRPPGRPAVASQTHHRGTPRLVIAPPYRWRPHAEQPHEKKHTRD